MGEGGREVEGGGGGGYRSEQPMGSHARQAIMQKGKKVGKA